MPFWSHNTWKAIPEASFPISPRVEENIREAEYRLSVGDEVYLTESGGASVRRLSEKESFSIAPGQFAFILTEDIVNLPMDVIGFITVRAAVKFTGLVNVSGFHVDPGYHGKLIFAVFNSGPKRINLQRGDSIFSIWLASLDAPIPEEKRPKPGYDCIPTSVINGIDGNHLTAFQLAERISVLQDRVEKAESTVLETKEQMFEYRVYARVLAAVFAIAALPALTWAIPKYWSFASDQFSFDEPVATEPVVDDTKPDSAE